MTEQEEYAERPVPRQARLGFAKPALVWAGFAYAYICIFIGSQIMGGLGAPLGYAAIISGQIFLFVYSGLIAHKGAALGLNFSLMCKAAFGKYGYAAPVLLIAGLVTGWFAFQGWLAGDLTVGLYGGKSFNAGTGSGILPGIFGTTAFWGAIWTATFGIFAVYGIRAMAWMGRFAVVSVTVLAAWMIYSILTVVASGTGGNPLMSHTVGHPWTFALGFTASIGTFIVSSTMTGDFTRWTKNTRQAWGVTAVAFPICNLLMLMVGGIFTAVAGKLDFFFGLGAIGLGIPIMIIQWASNGSTCDGCMYNATQGFKNVSHNLSNGKFNLSWKKIASIVVLVGAGVAAANLLTSIVPWLLLLGTVVSLVGGVLIGHFWVVARKSTPDEILTAADRVVNIPAIIGLLVGIVIAVIIAVAVPDLPAVIGGLIGGVGVYPAVARYMGYTKGGRLTDRGIGVSIDRVSGTRSTSDIEDQRSSRDPSDESTSTRISDIHEKDNMNSKHIDRIFRNIEKIAQLLAPYWFSSSSSSSSSMGRGGSS
jgi:cytosine permease